VIEILKHLAVVILLSLVLIVLYPFYSFSSINPAVSTPVVPTQADHMENHNYYSVIYSGGYVSIHFSSELIEAEAYWDLEYLLDSLPENTEIHLFTSGYGGDVNTIVQLMSALAPHKKHITVYITGPAYSADALMSCIGSKYVVSPGAILRCLTNIL
jgi:ATP-dependent protease ClpP protease subunit